MPWPCYVSPQKSEQIWGWCASLPIVCTCLAFMELHLFLGPMLDSKTRSTFFTEKAREWSATWTDSKLNTSGSGFALRVSRFALQSNPWGSPLYWQTRHRTCRTPLYWSQTQLRWSGIQALDPFSPPHYVKSPGREGKVTLHKTGSHPAEKNQSNTVMQKLLFRRNQQTSVSAPLIQASLSKWKVSRYAHHWHKQKTMARGDMYPV